MHIENLTPFQAQFTMAFDSDGREMIVVVCKATFDMPTEDGAPCTVADTQKDLQMADELSDSPAMAPIVETDFVPIKPRCDVIVLGRAHAPRNHEVKAQVVSLRVGNLFKEFKVVGPRVWQKRFLGYAMSEAQSFTAQPITYEQAWGGSDPDPLREGYFATCETNPAGVGYYPYNDDPYGLPLPNTEAMNETVSTRNGGYRPMAFGPIGRVWLPRRQYAGTYDEAWQNTRMPFPPKDLDGLFFQSAPPDQQMAYPKGGEAFKLGGLSPDGDLQGLIPQQRVVFRFERKSGRLTQKVGHMDTLTFFPEDKQLCMCWRAHLKPDRDIFDLKQVTVMGNE